MSYNEHLFKLADALDQSGNQKVATKVDTLLLKLAQEEKQGLISKITDMISSGAKSLKDLISEHLNTFAQAVSKNPELLKMITSGEAVSKFGLGLEEFLSALSIEDLALLLI